MAKGRSEDGKRQKQKNYSIFFPVFLWMGNVPVTLALNVEERKIPEGLVNESQSVTAKRDFIL